MTMPGLVVVKTEVHHIDADNVAAFLRSKGLDAMVQADDAGGELPALNETRFVKVLVPESEAEEAKRLIAEAESGALAGEPGDEGSGDGE